MESYKKIKNNKNYVTAAINRYKHHMLTERNKIY